MWAKARSTRARAEEEAGGGEGQGGEVVTVGVIYQILAAWGPPGQKVWPRPAAAAAKLGRISGAAADAAGPNTTARKAR